MNKYTVFPGISLVKTNRTAVNDIHMVAVSSTPLGSPFLTSHMVIQRLQELLSQAKDGDVLKKILNPHLGSSIF